MIKDGNYHEIKVTKFYKRFNQFYKISYCLPLLYKYRIYDYTTTPRIDSMKTVSFMHLFIGIAGY